MKKFIALLFVATLPLVVFTAYNASDSAEESAIKELVLTSYVHGAFNELNPEAMAAGFHPDFAIFSAKGEELARYEISDWISGVKKRKASERFDASKNVWDHKFSNVRITGNAATIQVDLSKSGKHVYTDYLSLLKFDSGWKIVAKVYYQHPKG